MLTRPPATNRRILGCASVAVLAIGVAQLAQATAVQRGLGVLFVVAAVWLALAAWRPLAMLVFAGFGSLTVACIARGAIGQFIPNLVWQQHVILACSWGLLSWGSYQRARDAWRIAHRGTL